MSISSLDDRAFVALGNESGGDVCRDVRGPDASALCGAETRPCVATSVRRLNTAARFYSTQMTRRGIARRIEAAPAATLQCAGLRGRVRVGTAWRMQQFAPVKSGRSWEEFRCVSLLLTSVALCAAAARTTPAGSRRRPPPYGEPINLETAKKAVARGREFAAKNELGACASPSSVRPAISSISRRTTHCQYASIAISQHKARAAATFRRPTMVFEDCSARAPSSPSCRRSTASSHREAAIR